MNFSKMFMIYFLNVLYDYQIYREFLRLLEGVGFKVYYISKLIIEKRLEKKYGRYLQVKLLCMCLDFFCELFSDIYMYVVV